MKQLLMPLLLFFINLAHGQQQFLSIDLKNRSLEEGMQQFTNQSGIYFSYSADLINSGQLVSVKIHNALPEDALKTLLKGTGIEFRISGNQAILFPAKQRNIVVSGSVREKGTGELLLGATVTSIPLIAGSITNSYGFYSITLPADTFSLQFSYIGYRKTTIALTPGKFEYQVELEPNPGLAEVVVTGGKEELTLRPNKVDVSFTEIKSVPMILGERDVVKYIMLSPGIQKGNEGNGYLYVRGGGPDQNLILIDDAVIYNAYHFLGLASLFSGNELRRAELFKGGFSSRYGGRLSSVLDMSMKDGNNERYGAEVSTGVMASKVLVEGPMVKNKSSFLISARKSYINKVAKAFAKNAESVLDYGYVDLHGKISSSLGAHDRLMLSGYFGQDQLGNNSGSNLSAEDDGISWGNRAASLRWSHQFNSRMFANTSLVNSRYQARIAFGDLVTGGSIVNATSSSIQSVINDYTLKQDIDYSLNNHNRFQLGAGFTRHQFQSTTALKTFSPVNVTSVTENENTNDAYVYLEHRFKSFVHWELITGLRYSYYKNDASYHRAEPRFQLLYHSSSSWTLSGSYAVMNQYLHLVSAFNGFGLPSDAWVPASNKLKPQQSQIITLSAVKNNLFQSDISFSVELYAKQMQNTVSLKEGASFYQVLPLPLYPKQAGSWSDLITQGNGFSYGSEFLIRKTGQRLTTQISYTLSKTTLQFEELNLGHSFPATFDRTHDLGIYLAFNAGKHFRLSANWVYGTGNAITLPAGEYFPTTSDPSGASGGGSSLYYKEKNSARMQSYHRLDGSAQYLHKLRNGIQSTIELSLYNMYNRANPFFYQIESRNPNAGNYTRTLQKVSLFPIMPSISWSIKF